jgi:hypothetical protein
MSGCCNLGAWVQEKQAIPVSWKLRSAFSMFELCKPKHFLYGLGDSWRHLGSLDSLQLET